MVCVCGGGRAEWVCRVSSQEEGKLGPRENSSSQLSNIWPGQGACLLCRGEARRGRAYMDCPAFPHKTIVSHQSWEHELILGLLKHDPFLPREVTQPQSLVPRTVTGPSGAPCGRERKGWMDFFHSRRHRWDSVLIGSQSIFALQRWCLS